MSKDFDDRFRPADPASGPYFYYVVNVHKATLDVHVMRPSLSFRFTHSRALKANLPPSKIAKMFERKTTGFLALVSPPSPSLASASKIQEPRPRLSPGRHTVLAWAKSGHGAGKNGDLVDSAAGSHTLSNNVWARQVIRLAEVLDLKMDSPFDTMGVSRQDGVSGVFRASHVEVKLAAHAIELLLHVFSPPATAAAADDITATRRRLRELRWARWTDGSRPAFDIVISRKNCDPCHRFVSRLSRLTGVEMNIIWGQELVAAVYKQPVMPRRARQRGGAEGGHDQDGVDDDDEMNDDDDEINHDHDDINDVDNDIKMDDVAQIPVANAPTPVPITPAKQVVINDDSSTPTNRPRRHVRAPAPRPVPGGIIKPLPATPETEPPSWMAPAVRERRRHQWHSLDGGRSIVAHEEDEE